MFKLLLNKNQIRKSDFIDSLKQELQSIAVSLYSKGIILLEQSNTHITYIDDDQIFTYEIA